MNNQIATTDESTAIIQVIERAAMNPDVDIEKMERLLSMQERILDRNAQAAFNAAMTAAQSEMPQVLKSSKNDQTRSTYADLEAINKAIVPVYTSHGFSLSFGTGDAPEGHYRVTCDIAHSAGHTQQRHVDVPIDAAGIKGNTNKTGTHAFGSTMSYGRRYLTVLIWNVATTDDNDGNDNSTPAERRQRDNEQRLQDQAREKFSVAMVECLEEDDEAGMLEIWDEQSNDEQEAAWGRFGSAQRSKMKLMIASAREAAAAV